MAAVLEERKTIPRERFHVMILAMLREGGLDVPGGLTSKKLESYIQVFEDMNPGLKVE